MEDKREKILEKLRKLMNLKESASALGNEGEANAAAAGIQRLLMEYNLSESDIPEQERIDNPVISSSIPYRYAHERGAWYESLVSVVCKFNLTEGIKIGTIQRGLFTPDEFNIVGRKLNVEVSLYLISFLAHHFTYSTRSAYVNYQRSCIRRYGKVPLDYPKYTESFLLGCVSGVRQKFSEEQQEEGLVLSTQKEIKDFLANKKIGKERRQQNKHADSLAASQGVSVGRNINIAKGMEGRTRPSQRRIS